METRFPPRNSIFSSLPSTFYAPLETVLITFFFLRENRYNQSFKYAPLLCLSLCFSFINVILFFFVLFCFVFRAARKSGKWVEALFNSSARARVCSCMCAFVAVCAHREKVGDVSIRDSTRDRTRDINPSLELLPCLENKLRGKGEAPVVLLQTENTRVPRPTLVFKYFPSRCKQAPLELSLWFRSRWFVGCLVPEWSESSDCPASSTLE